MSEESCFGPGVSDYESLVDADTVTWQQTVRESTQTRLQRCLGYLNSDSERTRHAIAVGFRQWHSEFDPESREDRLRVRRRARLGTGPRVYWVQTAPQPFKPAMAAALPDELTYAPARARALISLGLDEIEAAVGGEVSARH